MGRSFRLFYTESSRHGTRASRKLTPTALRPVRQPAFEKNVASWQPCTRQALLSRTSESPEIYPIVTTGLSHEDPPAFLTLRASKRPLATTCLDLCTQVNSSKELKRHSAPVAAQAPRIKDQIHLRFNWMHALMQYSIVVPKHGSRQD